MPNGTLDALLDDLRVDEPKPVVVADVGADRGRSGAGRAGAEEARRRGAPLRRVEGSMTAATAMAGRASLLVVPADALTDHGADAPWHGDLARLTCPVLLTWRPEVALPAPRRGPVVALVSSAHGEALPVVDAAAAAAVGRRTGLHIMHIEPVHTEAAQDAACTDWIEAVLAGLGLARPLSPSSPVTVDHVAGGVARVRRSLRGGVLVVLDGSAPAVLWPELRRRRADVLVVPRGPGARGEGARAVYRAALVEEIAATPGRDDGCTTAEDLDDLWRLGTASPQVSGRVVRAWRACLDPRAGARVKG